MTSKGRGRYERITSGRGRHIEGNPHPGGRHAAPREGRGMSQEELAKAAGVDETSIADWEAGKAKPMRRSRERLEEFFRGQRMEK